MDAIIPLPTVVCGHCGKDASAHHEFKPVQRPAGCVCRVTDWIRNHEIPPVCAEFTAAPGRHYCERCQHNRGCHGDVA